MKHTGFNSYKSWGIAVVCSVVNFLALLPIRISGLLFVALMEYYGIRRKMASQPVIIATTLRTSLGPLVGYLVGVYECRTMMIWGAILSSVGIGACFFGEDITFVTISIGLVYGLGMAFSNTLVPLVIKQHFDKHASKAQGLSLIGCCLNAILIPPIFEYFLETYGISGAFLVTSGIMLNGLPAGMLLRNPNYQRTLVTIEEPKHQESRPVVIAEEVVVKPHHVYESEKLMTTLDLDDVLLQSGGSLHCSTVSLATLDEKSSLVLEGLDCNVCVLKTQPEDAEEIDAFIGTNENGVRDLKPLPHETKRPITRWSRFAIFKQPSYLVLLVTQAAQGLVLFTIWTIVIDLARDKNIPSHQELYFLMFLPVSEMFGYLGLTWVTDGGHLTIFQFCVCSYALLAFCCVALVVAQTFWALMAAILSFSFVSAAISTVLPVMVFEVIEEEHHAMGMASRFILMGPAGFALPSVIGFFRESLGSYDGLLYLLASLSLLSSFLFILLPYIVSYKSKKGKS